MGEENLAQNRRRRKLQFCQTAQLFSAAIVCFRELPFQYYEIFHRSAIPDLPRSSSGSISCAAVANGAGKKSPACGW
jgi:hypothetical protein